jgi:hypothetical protein
MSIDNEQEKKLEVLSHIAGLFNKEKITWALGGSLLLFIKGKCDTFHDLDLMVQNEDGEKAKTLLKSLGQLEPPNPTKQYKTKDFSEFKINGVEIDLMVGFVIVKDGVDYDCQLTKDQIVEVVEIKGNKIPLQPLSLWRKYYQLMGRDEKVKMIDK